MTIDTRSFGELPVNEEKIINFNPIPGFPDSKRYILVYDEKEDDNIFCWLQSVDEPNVVFAVLNTPQVYKDYIPVVEKDELGELQNTKDEDMLIFNIVVIPDDISKTTANLKAPVLIDSKKKIGRQVIASNEEYSIRHYIINDLNKRNG